MEAERPEKRQRTDEGLPDVVRSEIWFDDGNIILVDGHINLRIYCGVLAPQSADVGLEGFLVVYLANPGHDLTYLPIPSSTC